jgi:hypothetical protein
LDLRYAWHRKAAPIIISSSLNVIASGTLTVLFFFFRR